MGQALANYTNFEKRGYTLKAIFDVNPELIGHKLKDIEIMNLDTLEEYQRKIR